MVVLIFHMASDFIYIFVVEHQNYFDDVNEPDEESSEQDALSAREKEIIGCVVKGMTNKAIADTLSISIYTVITHRRNISRKLQIHSPAGLAIYAIANNLVNIEDIKDVIN